MIIAERNIPEAVIESEVLLEDITVIAQRITDLPNPILWPRFLAL
jgi:hypothetical protein